MATLKNVGIAYAASAGLLVAYNVRWKHLWGFIVGTEPKELPVVTVEGSAVQSSKNKDVSVVLLHGMWHDASYYQELQQLLARAGYTSHAINLLPGERLLPGGSQKELVADLEVTLQKTIPDPQQQFVLLGHSQGGLITQSALRNSQAIRKRAMGAVLLGTYPLGLTPPVALLKQPRNMYSDVGYLWICLFGKLLNTRYTKHIFLLPTTDETKPKMKSYMDGLLEAPSDGLVTMSHFPQTQTPVPLPTLILGAEQDCIYPPTFLTQAFKERFPNSQEIVAKDQAHCFVDPGWQDTIGKPLIAWLDDLMARKGK